MSEANPGHPATDYESLRACPRMALRFIQATVPAPTGMKFVLCTEAESARGTIHLRGDYQHGS